MKLQDPKVVVLSLIALACIVLAFVFKQWLLFIPAVLLWWLNKRELMEK